MASKNKHSKPKYRITITPINKITEDLRSWLRPDETPFRLQVLKDDEVVEGKDVIFAVSGKLNTTEKGTPFLTVGVGAIWATADSALLSLFDIGEMMHGARIQLYAPRAPKKRVGIETYIRLILTDNPKKSNKDLLTEVPIVKDLPHGLKHAVEVTVDSHRYLIYRDAGIGLEALTVFQLRDDRDRANGISAETYWKYAAKIRKEPAIRMKRLLNQ
jgi:hypothetical protein